MSWEPWTARLKLEAVMALEILRVDISLQHLDRPVQLLVQVIRTYGYTFVTFICDYKFMLHLLQTLQVYSGGIVAQLRRMDRCACIQDLRYQSTSSWLSL